MQSSAKGNQSNAERERDYQAIIAAIDRVIASLKPPSDTRIKSAVVALYTGNDTLKFSGTIGLLHLDVQRYKGCTPIYFLRLYELDTLDVLLEIQLYYGFYDNFQLASNLQMQHVYTFDYLEHGLIGLQFRNSAEGETMQLKIKELAPKMDALYQLTDIKNRKEDAQRKRQGKNRISKLIDRMLGTQQPDFVEASSEIISVTQTSSLRFDSASCTIHEDIVSKEVAEMLRRSGFASCKREMSSQGKQAANVRQPISQSREQRGSIVINTQGINSHQHIGNQQSSIHVSNSKSLEYLQCKERDLSAPTDFDIA